MEANLAIQVFYIVVLILSIIIHEVAHGWVAYALGDPTAKLAGRLTINPIPHIDLVGSVIIPVLCVLSPGGFLFGWAKPVPYNPYNLKNQRWGEALVASAGVLTNLFLAVVFAFVARFSVLQGFNEFAALAAIIVIVNLYLGLLNLIPFPPLDGFRILQGILPPRYSLAVRAFESRIIGGGFLSLIIFFLIFFYVLSGPFGLLVSFFYRLLVGV